MFDRIARRYDIINHVLSAGIDRCWRRKAARSLLPHHPCHMLDMACGTGDMSIELGHTFPSARITGVDISDAMLEIGKHKVRQRGFEARIELLKMDVTGTDFKPSSFDAVTIAFGIRNIGDREKALCEMHRVLRAKGQLLVLEFSMPQKGWPARLYSFYFNRMLPILGGVISGDFAAYRYFVSSVNHFPSPHQFHRMLEGCGFRILQSTALTGGIARMYLAEKHES